MNQSLAIVDRPQMSINIPPAAGLDEIESLKAIAKTVCYSGFLNSNSNNVAQRAADAFFVMKYGRELGIREMTALKTIYVIDGTPSCSGAALLGLLLKANIKVRIPDPADLTDRATIVIIRPDDDEEQRYSYSLQMAKEAELVQSWGADGVKSGKKNWRKHWRDMLIWRAVSIGAKYAASDVIGGLRTIEELRPEIEVDKDGSPVHDMGISIVPPPEQPPTEDELDAAMEQGSVPDAEFIEDEQPEDNRPDWVKTQTNIDTLVKKAQDELKATKTDLPKLANISKIDDTSTQTGWGQYETGKDAWLAIKANHAAQADPEKPENWAKKVIQWCEDTLELSTSEIVRLARITAIDDYTETGWGQYKNGNVAWTTINQNHAAELDGDSDLEPPVVADEPPIQPQPPANPWTDFDNHALIALMDDYGLPGLIGTLKMLDKDNLRDYPTPAAARSALTALAVERKSDLKVSRITYQGQYTDLHCGDLTVRAYGREHFRSLEGSALVTECEAWEKGKTYSVAEGTLSESVRVLKGKWESKDGNYLIVQKGGVSLGDIPF